MGSYIQLLLLQSILNKAGKMKLIVIWSMITLIEITTSSQSFVNTVRGILEQQKLKFMNKIQTWMTITGTTCPTF